MPIHRERYRRREGGVDLRGGAWAVIAANGLRALVRKRAFLFLMILAWIPGDRPRRADLGRRERSRHVADRMLAVTPQMFRDFLNQQEPLVFFITVYVGSGLIADDIRANALQLYLSRPITRTQYIAGKAAIAHGRAGGGHLRAGDAAVPARAGVCRQHDVPPRAICC